MRTITSHRENPPDGYYEQYKMRVHFLSIDDDENEDDSVTYRTGGGSRPRKRKSTKNRTTLSSNPNRRATKTEERWMDGVDLAPYEIASYWARFKRATVNQNQVSLTKQHILSIKIISDGAEAYKQWTASNSNNKFNVDTSTTLHSSPTCSKYSETCCRSDTTNSHARHLLSATIQRKPLQSNVMKFLFVLCRII